MLKDSSTLLHCYISNLNLFEPFSVAFWQIIIIEALHLFGGTLPKYLVFISFLISRKALENAHTKHKTPLLVITPRFVAKRNVLIKFL
jgi:hypothetical protein